MTGIELLKVIKEQDLDNAVAIILTFDMDKVDVETVKQVFDFIKDEFSDKQIFAIPKYINLHTVGEFEIRSLINTLTKLLYEINKSEPDCAENGYKC